MSSGAASPAAPAAPAILTRLRCDHVRIRDIVDGLSMLVARAEPPGLDAVAALRWRLTRQILTHLPIEDRYVYRPLERDTRPAVAHLAGAFRRELDALYGDFKEHMQRWTGAVIVSDWAGYRAAFPVIRDRLLERMMREETELFPLIDDAAPPPARGEAWSADADFFYGAIGGRRPG